MAYYVSKRGAVFTFTVMPNNKIKLNNGTFLDDPPDGKLFATQCSANKFSGLIHEHGYNAAKSLHRQWVRGGNHLKECK